MQNAVGVLHLAEVHSGLKRIEFQVHFLSCGTPLAFLFCAIYMLVGSITTARAQAPGTGAIAGVVLTPPERWFPTTIFAFRALGAKGSEVLVLIATYQLHEAAAG